MRSAGTQRDWRGAGWLRRGAVALGGGLLLAAATAAGLAVVDDGAGSALKTDVARAQAAVADSRVSVDARTAGADVRTAGADARTAAAAVTAAQTTQTARTVTKPEIVWKPVPFGAKRKAEMAAYCKRHYGDRSYKLKPKLVVLHFTAGGNWKSTWNYFANDAPDPEFHELPGPAAHFIIDKDGTIYQLVGTSLRSRHTYGLNHVAIGIEFVQEAGSSSSWADKQILARKAQVTAGLRLVRWLQKKYSIPTSRVIGHAMATQSKFYKDLLGRKIAHGDWQYSDIKVFRARLKKID